MKGQGSTSSAAHQAAIEENRKVVSGRLPSGPFETAPPVITDKDARSQKTLKQAMLRDLAYSSAGPVYLRNLGLHQAFRELYELGRISK